MSAGAPPDDFFEGGQSWAVPPVHPDVSRAEGHRYFAESLRHLMGPAGLMRVDHVMQLERLYWVPEGSEATEGAYVRYPVDELLAVLMIESHRTETGVIGENLGTVSGTMRRALEEHSISGQWVLQFECTGDPESPWQVPGKGDVVSLNTHDTSTHSGFLKGRDIGLLREVGLIDADTERSRRDVRDELVAPLRDLSLQQLLQSVAASPGLLMVVNLEDLWEEELPQNIPGTTSEYRNWRRKARRTMEQLSGDPEIAVILESVCAAARGPGDG